MRVRLGLGGTGDHGRFPRLGPSAALLLAGACAGAPAMTPLEEPAAAAGDLERVTAPDRPYHVTFSWEYADERGAVEGEGVLRFTPPDSLRLDLFSTGDASMAAALVAGSGLRVAGQIQDVRLPPPAFLYASAGLFRPGSRYPTGGYDLEDGGTLFVYAGPDDAAVRYRLADGRLQEVEERRNGNTVRRTRLSWSREEAVWPSRAEYRDDEAGRRARWTVERSRVPDEPFSPEIYDLPPAP